MRLHRTESPCQPKRARKASPRSTLKRWPKRYMVWRRLILPSWSPWLDLKIVLRTVPYALGKRGM